MKKQYCDFCGKEIDFELSDQVEIYDHVKDDYRFTSDACEDCVKKVLVFLKTLKK